ncbi:MAG: threonylcarbamoyl-AMP synthase [Chlorobi bacterium]|nr:threonylcarbamoyl-AMP synthase [Chlorobiota bacterium]
MAKYIKIHPQNPHPPRIAEAADILRRGGLVIYPTDTVYGLGASIKHPKAVERLAQIKGVKVQSAPITLLFHDLSQMSQYVKQIDTPTFKILKRATPGPYTFILPATHRLPKIFQKRKTIGFRIPDNPVLLEILRELGEPIVNISIKDDDEIIEYTTDPELIYEKWRNRVDAVVDGGILEKTPSTVIDLTEDTPVVVRQGKGPTEHLW